MLISCLDLIYTLLLLLGTFDMINLLFRLEPVKSFEAPTPIFSASLHPSKSCFVAGGDDFKLYKFDYADGKELGNWCVTFSNNFSLQLKLNMQTSIVCRPRGEGYSFIMGYILCSPKQYGFSAILVIYRVLTSADFGQHYLKEINKSLSQIMFTVI